MLIDIYIGILLWLLVNGICMIIGFYIGKASVWSEINKNGGISKEDGEEEDEDEYKPPEIKGEITFDGSAYIMTEGEKQIKWDANGLWCNSGDGKWKRLDTPIIEIQKEGRGKDGGK